MQQEVAWSQTCPKQCRSLFGTINPKGGSGTAALAIYVLPVELAHPLNVSEAQTGNRQMQMHMSSHQAILAMLGGVHSRKA